MLNSTPRRRSPEVSSHRYAWVFAITAVCLLLSVAGCGGGDDGNGSDKTQSGSTTVEHTTPPGKTVGEVLDADQGFFQQIFDSAAQSANGTVANAASDALLLIEKLRLTLDDVAIKADTVASRQLEHLNTILSDLQSHVQDTVDQAAKDARAFAASIRLSKPDPVVLRYSPQFAVAGTEGEVRVHIDGTFWFAKDPNLRPTLVVGQKGIPPSTSETTDLEFYVPRAELGAGAQASVKPISLTLTVPYTATLHHKSAEYALAVALLPPKPGEVMASWPVTEQVDGRPQILTSKSARATATTLQDDHKDIVIDADPGCRLLPDTREFKPTYTYGPHTKDVKSWDWSWGTVNERQAIAHLVAYWHANHSNG